MEVTKRLLIACTCDIFGGPKISFNFPHKLSSVIHGIFIGKAPLDSSTVQHENDDSNDVSWEFCNIMHSLSLRNFGFGEAQENSVATPVFVGSTQRVESCEQRIQTPSCIDDALLQRVSNYEILHCPIVKYAEGEYVRYSIEKAMFFRNCLIMYR